jgi:uncharacterized protein YaaN involved in tellurite resistance
MASLKKLLLVTLVALGFKARAQTQDIQQLVLDIEKLTQLKGILSDMKTGYQIYNQGYGAISSISKGNFDLHATYLNGLLAISPAVRNYSKVADILLQQAALVKAYRSAYASFKASGSFSVTELSYMSGVYTNLVNQSLQNLDELSQILMAGRLRMNDAERIRAIDRIEADSSDKLSFTRQFNNQGVALSLQRSKDANDTRTLKQLYGIPP